MTLVELLKVVKMTCDSECGTEMNGCQPAGEVVSTSRVWVG